MGNSVNKLNFFFIFLFLYFSLFQNNAQKLEDEENKENNPSGKYDTRKIYWDRDGNLRYGLKYNSFLYFFFKFSIKILSVKKQFQNLPSSTQSRFFMK